MLNFKLLETSIYIAETKFPYCHYSIVYTSHDKQVSWNDPFRIDTLWNYVYTFEEAVSACEMHYKEYLENLEE